MKKLFILLIAICFILPVQAQDPNYKLDELDKYFSKAREDWKVPALAIAIVKDGKIIFEKGYGQRDVKKGGEVDEHTMFAVASNTKTFTSTALGVLVEEGKVKWDDPVVKHLPWFRLYDPYVSENLTVRDLLCHRSGLVTFSGDLLWYGTTYSRREVIERARYLEPQYGFRTKFGYSNIQFLTAGEIIPEVSQYSWDNFIKNRFFKPLNMKRSITTTKQLKNFNNVASPHTEHEGEIISIPWLNWDNIAPAGSIISSAHDMSQWLLLHLNEGKVGEEQIFTAETQWELFTPQTVLPVSSGAARLWPSTHFKAYGLGFTMFDYHGCKVVGHNGGYDGMISQSMMVPEEDFGFVILTNKNSSLYYPLMYKILDHFLSEDDTDWSGKFLEFMERRDKADEKEKEEFAKTRIPDTKPSLDLDAYCGKYSGKLYGEAMVRKVDGKLEVRLIPAPGFYGTLKHWHFDTFRITLPEFPSLPEGSVNFVLNDMGEVEEMRIDIPNPDFDFTELKFFKEKE